MAATPTGIRASQRPSLDADFSVVWSATDGCYHRHEMVIEQRRHARAPIASSIVFFVKGESAERSGTARDISVGGMSVETTSPAPFGAEVVAHAQLPGSTETLALPAVVRWVRDGKMGLQFGLLGAKETHVITEIKRKHDESGAD